EVGEIKRRRALQASPPARDLETAARFDDVTRLIGRCRVAGDDVDAVDARYHEHAPAADVPHADRILVPRYADHVALLILDVEVEDRAARTVEQLGGDRRWRRWRRWRGRHCGRGSSGNNECGNGGEGRHEAIA